MENTTVEITLKNLLDWIVKGIAFILVIAILFGTGAFFYNKYFVDPVYSASVKFYASGIESVPTLGQSVAPQYVEFLNVHEFYEMVSKDLLTNTNMEISPKEISSLLSFSSVVEETSSFFVQVTATDPEKAYHVALSVAKMGAERVASFSDVGALEIIENPTMPTVPEGAGAAKSAVLGAVVGFVLAAAIVVLKEIFDNRIKGPDEITEIFKIPVFGVVPDFSETGKKGENK
ncbi:MAG: hypothetical protein IKU24_00035 [Clostridia bacterium]|nr:hypothetical protein [Clostridia bacterium]